MDLIERMELNSIPEPNTGCHLWLGSLVRNHGVIKVDGVLMQAHRLAWELRQGRIPDGQWVLHACGNPVCVNADHLKLGDAVQNGADASRHFAKHGVPRVVSSAAKRSRAQPIDMNADEVRRVLDYDPRTGIFLWKHRPDREQCWNTKHAGKVAGSTLPIGYRYIMMLGKLHLAHRLAFLWMTSEWPVAQVDHINSVRTDNRWANLRGATPAQNAVNVLPRGNNTSGVTGVSWNPKRSRWYAYVRVDGRMRGLGLHPRFEDAVAARRAAEALHYGEFANRGPV